LKINYWRIGSEHVFCFISTSIFHWLLSCWLPNVLWQILHACAERKHIQQLLEDLDKMGMRLWPLPIERASYIHHMGTCSENLDCVMLIVTSVQSYIPTIPFDKKFINKYEKISVNTNVVFRRSCITMTNQQSNLYKMVHCWQYKALPDEQNMPYVGMMSLKIPKG
jgi:hypothetical protein